MQRCSAYARPVRKPGRSIRGLIGRDPARKVERIDAREQRQLAKAQQKRDRKLSSLQATAARHRDQEKQIGLWQYPIDSCDVAQIGPTTRATLKSNGIDTAEALSKRKRKLRRLPGINQVREGSLLMWLDGCEREVSSKRQREREMRVQAETKQSELPAWYEGKVKAIHEDAEARRRKFLNGPSSD